MSAKYIIFCVCISLQYHLIFTSDSCQSKTCQECISDTSVCVWCAANDFNGTDRCKPQSTYESSWCPNSLENPNNTVTASEAKPFSSDSDHIVQIKPQRYKLKLRPGLRESFNFSFQAAKDFPVDLYFLLDASYTMKKVRDMTANQSQNIYLAIKEMTKNVNLGFGTFIDKRVYPFTNNTQDTELTYSFRHRLKLSDDFKQFKEQVANTQNGVNRDKQEGGLDALAQVMACKDVIGWRNESRKIVVFLTDGPYHAAGDGKSAGLFKPYDGKCYTEKGSYTKELVMDYPSVGMINKLATESDIIVIFLVHPTVQSIYHDLSRVVSGSEALHFYQGKDTKNDAIVTILKENYKKISKTIKLLVKVKSGSKKDLGIDFNPNCLAGNDEKDNTACDVETGKEHHIKGTVQYNGTDNAVVDIVVEGIGEKLTLEIEVIKSCDCERNVEHSSAFCHGEKRLCGKCSCSESRFGERCACIKSENNGITDNSTCIAPGSKDICSGHGSCFCGTCTCREGLGFVGKYCECDVNRCPRGTSSGKVCDGEDHGKCECDGKCKCRDGWSGDACDCYNLNTYCKGIDGSICHNQGQCVCGACQCKIADWDARKSQDSKCQMQPCTDCHELQCRKLTNCARCTRNENTDCWDCEDPTIRAKVVQTLTEEHLNSSLWNFCSNYVKAEIGCQASFVYRYVDYDYSVEVVVAKDKDCAPNYYGFGGLFLLILLLVGAGTLIAWKLLTEARDRHEYLQFMQQNKSDMSGPSSNPLYEPPTTTFNNPAFRKRSVDER